MPSRRHLAAVGAAPFSYTEVGATTGCMPDGYRVVRRSQVLGSGREVFDEAVLRVMTWQMHRAAGLQVTATAAEVRVGAVVLLGVGFGWFRLHAPCRVVLVVDEPRQKGFAYGTLVGHPESGEELFTVALDDADRVRFTITAFSRPASRWSRLGGPVGRRIQDLITDRYVAALRSSSTS